MNLTLDNGKSRIRFSSHKECRRFINQISFNGFISNRSIKNRMPRYWMVAKPKEEFWGIKLGKILKINGLSIYFESHVNITQREYSLESLLQ